MLPACTISFGCSRLLTLKIIFLCLGVHLVVRMSIDNFVLVSFVACTFNALYFVYDVFQDVH